MKCSGATGLDISSFPEIKVGGKKKINEMIKKKVGGAEVLYLDSIFRPNPKLSIWGELLL